MAEIETQEEVSTPVETVEEETSLDVEPAEAETSTEEPESIEVPAETETETKVAEPPVEEQKLYAGKYKSIEELEKGYKELNGSFTKSKEFENKYNELLKQQQEQADKMRAYQLQQANQKGFKTVEDAQIADRVQLAEFQYYWTNLNTLNPEYVNEVKPLLENYYQTANRAYLEEAKRYYSSNFIEQVAIATNGLEHNLRTQLEQEKAQQKNKAEEDLANTLRTDFAEFLGDLKENTGKAKALEAFCGADFITSVEDMKAFENIYSQIAKYEREQAIKEYEAQKTIEETKAKAVIGGGTSTTSIKTGLKDTYTQAEIAAMSMEEYNALCDKYGDTEIDKRII